MKTKKRFFLLALSALIFVNVHTLNAQVTIGSEQEPNVGALLDLKQNAEFPGTNSTKGFNLPRVALTNLSSLSPCAADNAANKKSHTGLTVYNTTNGNGFIPSTYVWNGSSWITSSNRAKLVDANLTDLKVTDIAANSTVSITSLVIPESGYYIITSSMQCVRTSAVDTYYYFYLAGDNNYTNTFNGCFMTTAYPVSWAIPIRGTIVDYFEAGTYYIKVVTYLADWIYRSSTLSLVKLSD